MPPRPGSGTALNDDDKIQIMFLYAVLDELLTERPDIKYIKPWLNPDSVNTDFRVIRIKLKVQMISNIFHD